MGRKERCAHAEKHLIVRPRFGEEIVALVKPNAMQRLDRATTVDNQSRQHLRRYRQLRQLRNIMIQVAMVESRANLLETRHHIVVSYDRPRSLETFLPKGDAATVVV